MVQAGLAFNLAAFAHVTTSLPAGVNKASGKLPHVAKLISSIAQ
jgi:hypothetical protein